MFAVSRFRNLSSAKKAYLFFNFVSTPFLRLSVITPQEPKIEMSVFCSTALTITTEESERVVLLLNNSFSYKLILDDYFDYGEFSPSEVILVRA